MIVNKHIECDGCHKIITVFKDMNTVQWFRRTDGDCLIDVRVEKHYCNKCIKKVKL